MAARWEQLLRLRLLRVPRHFSANDGASSLLYFAAFALLSSLVLALLASPMFRYALSAFGFIFAGLSLQQYSFYTAETFSECWAVEGPLVVAVILAASVLLSS
ncbi:MAG: hypothetical protein SGPRY_010844, partial [Prymnesium sp.]